MTRTHERKAAVARSQRQRVIQRSGGYFDKHTSLWRLPDGRTFATMDEAYAVCIAKAKRGRQ